MAIELRGLINGKMVDTLRKGVNALPAAHPVEIELATEGGRLSDGILAYTLLKNSKREVRVEMVGDVFSAGTLLLCAANNVDMPSNTLVMVHEPWVPILSPATLDEVSRTKRYLEATKKQAVEIYHARTGRDRKEIAHAMEKETYFDGPEALAFGLIDNVTHARHDVVALAADRYPVRDTEKLNAMLKRRRTPADVELILQKLGVRTHG